MGIVMQTKSLFNFSIKENILYGQPQSSNEEIIAACELANARSFIESEEMLVGIEDTIVSLVKAMESQIYKQAIIEQIGYDEYETKLSVLNDLCSKEEN